MLERREAASARRHPERHAHIAHSHVGTSRAPYIPAEWTAGVWLKQSARFKAVSLLPKEGPFGAVRNRLNPASKLRDSRREETRKLSDGIFTELQRDEEFWRRFA